MFRIIPRLDIKPPCLIKGINLEGVKKIGDPRVYGHKYFEEGADEIFFQDITASLYGRNAFYQLVNETAGKVYVPLTVGGGIRCIEDARSAFQNGADRVAINSAGILNPDLVAELVDLYGSQAVVGVIEAAGTVENSSWEVVFFSGRERSGLGVVDWAKKLENLGVGELVITSVPHEGLMNGCNLGLMKEVREAINLPLIAHGGIGNVSHVLDLAHSGVDGVVIASALHYSKCSIQELKSGLSNKGVEVRV